MPEEPDFVPLEEPDMANRFEDWLEEQAEDGTVSLYDLNWIDLMIYVRLRQIATPQMMHMRAHALIEFGERLLHTPGAMVDPDTGQDLVPILIENATDPQAHLDMLSISGQEVDDQAIADLIASELMKGEEEE